MSKQNSLLDLLTEDDELPGPLLCPAASFRLHRPSTHKWTSSFWTHSSALDTLERSFSFMILTIVSMTLTPKYCPLCCPRPESSPDLKCVTGQCCLEAATLRAARIQRPSKTVQGASPGRC